MPVAETPTATSDTVTGEGAEHADAQGPELEVLVEEISIDGMCGVY